MGLFSFDRKSSARPSRKARASRRAALHLEALEDRLTPTGNVISGFVYADANNNGVFDPGESPIPNTTVTLKNSANQVVGVAVTDSTGFYQFSADATINSTPKTITQSVSFGPTDTDFDLTAAVNQFNPNLGQLTEVDIEHDGSIVSAIKVENTSKSSGTKITAGVSGDLNLIAPGVNDNLSVSQIIGSYTAGKYDGTTDFAGSSGNSFGAKTASGSHTLTLTSNLGGWQGSGTVTLEELASATSDASGGGNVQSIITSTGSANITVVYRYIPNNNLKPGNYTLVETQPPTYIDGLDAANGVVIPGSNKTDTIPVTLTNVDVPNNDFGELQSSVLSGHVYYDSNSSGTRDASDPAIPGTTVTLTGSNDLGSVNVVTTTDPSGFYSFPNLRPGTYIITETQPANYKEGTDNLGTLGGNPSVQDVFSSITVPMGANGQNYDFGELNPANADLGIVKTANPASVAVNGTLVYTLAITNYGTFTAQGVQVVDTLPPGVTLVSAFGNGWSVSSSGGIITATMPTLAVGVTSTITVTIIVPGIASTITNTATVTSTTPDSNPLNNTSTVTTPVTIPDPVIKTLDTNRAPGGPIQLKTGLLVWSVGTAAAGAVNQQDVAMVDGLFVTLTGQHADNATLVADANAVTKGTLTSTALIATLMNTDAYRTIETTNLYQSILGRAPTALELQSTIASLKAGASTQNLSLSLYSSAEFQSLNSTGAAATLVGSLYIDITGALPTATVSSASISSLGTTPISQLVQSLQASPAAATQTIDSVFRLVMRRNPTSTELATYLPQIMSGQITDQSLTALLLASSDFRNLAIASQH